MSWLDDWEEAAKHPARTFAFIFLSGFVSCGLIGYFRFGRSVGWGIAIGLVGATTLTAVGRHYLREPVAVPRPARAGALRLALLFGAILLAVVVGVATGSPIAFVATPAVVLAAALLLRLR